MTVRIGIATGRFHVVDIGMQPIHHQLSDTQDRPTNQSQDAFDYRPVCLPSVDIFRSRDETAQITDWSLAKRHRYRRWDERFPAIIHELITEVLEEEKQ